jgi:hypothetical protein
MIRRSYLAEALPVSSTAQYGVALWVKKFLWIERKRNCRDVKLVAEE